MYTNGLRPPVGATCSSPLFCVIDDCRGSRDLDGERLMQLPLGVYLSAANHCLDLFPLYTLPQHPHYIRTYTPTPNLHSA